MAEQRSLIPLERIEQAILLIRGQKVMLDFDLAVLYDVPTKVLKQAVKRNIRRFPEDFMFQLSKVEMENWRSHFVTSNPAAKMGLRRPPFAFTEQGVAMLASVLNSERAIQVNIAIMRTFVKLRQIMATHKELAHKLASLERKIKAHDTQIRGIFDVIHQLMTPPEPKKRPIGFLADRTDQ